MLMYLPIVIAAALPVSPVADNVPRLDVARECRTETEDQAGRQHCTEEENQALQQIKKEWQTFSAADRRFCEKEAAMGGAGSYVELVTCLEMTRDTRNNQNAQNQDTQNQGSRRARK
jgi:hypothetical protein